MKLEYGKTLYPMRRLLSVVTMGYLALTMQAKIANAQYFPGQLFNAGRLSDDVAMGNLKVFSRFRQFASLLFLVFCFCLITKFTTLHKTR